MAVSVQTWAPSSAVEFGDATLSGTALDREGHVTLGPTLQNLWGPEPGVVWDLAAGGSKGPFVALSGPGRVLRLPTDGPPEVWYESTDEVLVTALASRRGDEVFYGLSPQGQVLRSTRPDRRESWLAVDAKFIWALEADADGGLWVATGTPGTVLRKPRDGDPETLFESGDDPVRCLARLPNGGVVAGTGEQGRVIRLAPGERPFVLLDADETEVVSVAVAADGAIYALTAGTTAAGGRSARAAPAGDTITVKATPPEDDGDGEEEEGEQQPSPRPRPAPQRRGGALYRIDPDGGVLKIWSRAGDSPYAVAIREDRVLVATGPEGTILELDSRGEGAGIVRFPSNQPSALALAPDGRLLVGGTEDARVAVLGPGPMDSGSWTGKPVDAERVADWGAIRWDAQVPAGATLAVDVRAGNTDQPDDTWSEWREVAGDDPEAGSATGVPAARWLQVRVRLTPSPSGRAPVLNRIELSYLPRNRPPEIGSLTVEPVGVAWAEGPTPSQAGRGPKVADDPVARRAAESLLSRPATPRIAKAYEVGARTFTWKAEDPDSDRLSYRLELRREGESRWFPLAEQVSESFYSWDSRAMPDGLYRVRVTADDAADNPNGRHYASERISDPFRIDNTPPAVVEFGVRKVAAGVEVRFLARDPGGRVEAAEYALDGRNWKSLDPEDGVADSRQESYRVTIGERDLRGSNRTIMVRVVDASGNLGGDMRVLSSDGPD